MEENLAAAERALRAQDGRQALTCVQAALDQDERCARAWFIAMQCFQFLTPIEGYDPDYEIRCARYAIRYASKEEKTAMRRRVYLFLMQKILDVLNRDAQVLADGRELISFYQRVVYFDASGAAGKTEEKDRPVMQAVMNSFSYCEALFDVIPDSAIKRNAALNKKAAEVAHAWEMTFNYLSMRVNLYHKELAESEIRHGLARYARYLRSVRNREEILAKPVPFNTLQLDQIAFLNEPAAPPSNDLPNRDKD